MEMRYRKLLFFLMCLIISSCSPRINRNANPVVKPVVEAPKPKPDVKPVPKFTEAKVALLIPFKLNQINLNTATKAQMERTDMAIDFYQGVKMGIDSAATLGLNFRLHVYDSRDDDTQLNKLIQSGELSSSNLIIGPVFPVGLKGLTPYVVKNDLTLVSPLAASRPSEFNNPKLISIVNHIDQHGEKLAEFIGSKYNSDRGIVVFINPKKPEDEEFAAPVRAYLKSKFPNLLIQEFSSASMFETRMIKGKKYAVVVPSSDVSFVTLTVDKLSKLAKIRASDYEIQLFGHPNWAKQHYNVDQLQSLNTVISTSYHINYKDLNVINFVKRYRANFNYEPTEFSFKGFDIGFYFGKILTKYGKNYLDYLIKEKYKGLHNSFVFAFDPLYGYYNKELSLVQYKNLSLAIVH